MIGKYLFDVIISEVDYRVAIGPDYATYLVGEDYFSAA